MFCYNIISAILILLGSSSTLVFGQGNCLLYPENSGERKACELSYQAIELRQGSQESQELFDQAIEVGPNYAYAYYQKSVPFFKRGLLSDGLALINKAIDLEPENYLHYRAYYYFYYRSYDLCISDLEALYTTHKKYYITTPGGELEMRLLLAMSYAYEGNETAGIVWIKDLMERCEEQPELKGQFDDYILGLLYFKNNQYDLAQESFEKQIVFNKDFADTYYYLGLIYKKDSQVEEAEKNFKLALDKMNRVDGGYSANMFTEFDVDVEMVKVEMGDL